MAETSKIEWTDATWNIVTGCSVVSPACTNCYAMRLAGTRLKHLPSRAGLTREVNGKPVWTGEVRINWQWLEQPLQWTRARKIFVAAHGDLFHEGVAASDLATIFAVMIAAHHTHGHTFQVLTKRARRMRELLNDPEFWADVNAAADSYAPESVSPLPHDYGPANPPPGIWLGVTAEDQQRTDERIPDLLSTPAAVRFVSCEPLLGVIDLTAIKFWSPCNIPEFGGEGVELLPAIRPVWRKGRGPGLDLVIAGGESGPDARPSHPDWFRSLRDQCAASGVAFFFKQWGEWASIYDRDRDDPDWRACPREGDWDRKRYLNFAGGQGFHGEKLHFMKRVGKRRAGRLLDDREHNAFPETRP